MKESMAEKATKYMEKAADLENEVKKLKEAINGNGKEMIRRGIEIERLKAQNKLMWDALLCLPGANGVKVTNSVCNICSKSRSGECLWSSQTCVIDKATKAIREGMGG